MSSLRPPYKALLRVGSDTEARERMWRRIEARRVRGVQGGGSRRHVGVLVGALVGVAVALLLTRSPQRSARLLVASAAHLAGAPSVVPERIACAEGTAHFTSRAGAPRIVDAGLAKLTFDDASVIVLRSRHKVSIRVERGEVDVQSSHLREGQAHLSAGMLLEVDDLEPAVSAGGAGVGAIHGTARGSAEPERKALASADAGAVDGAKVSGLLARADVARLSGHPREAISPLDEVLREHANDARAGLAAYTLGRVYLDEVPSPNDAVTALERALSLGVPAALEEDAYARLVEAYARAGNGAGARTAYERARRRFPAGVHDAAMQKWLEPR